MVSDRGIEEEIANVREADEIIPEQPVTFRRSRTRRDGEGQTSGAGATEAQVAQKTETTRPARRRKAKKAESDAGELAHLLVKLVNIPVTAAYGPEAGMNEFERALIEPSLADLLARTSDRALERFASFSSVIMLGGGLVMWGMRVHALRSTPAETPPLEGVTVVSDEPTPEALAWREILGKG